MSVKHIELTDDDMSGVAGLELEKRGWIGSEVDGKIVWNMPGSFGSRNLCWQDAMKLQQIIDKWSQE